MSIKLLPVAQILGVESQTALLNTFWLWVTNAAVFTPPVTVANIKAALDAGQPQPYSTEAFDKYLLDAYNLPIDTTLLTLAERTIFNTIREHLEPPPSAACCGVDVPSAANTTRAVFDKIGDDFKYELQIQFDIGVDCNAFDVLVGLSAVGGSPAPIGSPYVCQNLGCVGGKWVFSKLYIDFAASPSGKTYDFDITVRDKTLATIANYPMAGFVFP